MSNYPDDVPLPHIERPGEHQIFTGRLWAALERCACAGMATDPGDCWRVNFKTNIFVGTDGKSDFTTPDFLVYRCLESSYQDVRSADVLLVGEVLSSANSRSEIEAKKARYASAGIPVYWEVDLAREASAIAAIRVYALQTGPVHLQPEGVRLLHTANYLLSGEWTPADTNGIEFDSPFPIQIPWSELEF